MAIFLLLILTSELVIIQESHAYTYQLRELVTASNDFGLKLYKKFAEKEKQGNIIFSPLSISLAFAMTSLGAKGNTLQEIHSTIAAGIPQDQIHTNFKRILNVIPRNSEIETVRIANKLYGQRGTNLVISFLQSSQRYYKSSLQTLDFSNNAESVSTINNWVSQTTNGKITDIIQSRDINANTRLVLVDVLYFKARWDSAFKKQFTKPQNFFIRPKKPVEIDFLHDPASIGLYGVHETLNFEVFEKDFKLHSFRFGIILPNLAKTSLERIQKMLSTNVLKATKIKQVTANVTIPKFKINSSHDLRDNLVALGMRDLFSNAADLSGLERSKRLYLQKAFHQTVIDIVENGVIATAATANIVDVKSGFIHEEPVVNFRADHPFLFYIKHTRTGSMLFFGKFSRP